MTFNSYEWKFADKTYNLRLTTRNIIRLEKELKKNPLSIFLAVENDVLPTTEDIITVLYYSLLACHEGEFKTIDNVYDIYDEYINDGGSLVTLIPVLLDVFKISGIIPQDETETTDKVTEKN